MMAVTQQMACTLAALAALAPLPNARAAEHSNYPANREPLLQTEFTPLPLGAIKPAGWLRDQLVVQANGMTGHLDEFWKTVSDSAWKGGPGDPWERGPYYLDGLVPLAYELDDARLIAKVKEWMEPILASQKPNGWFGPEKNKDRWPLSVALKVLSMYHEATGDDRAMKVIAGYIQYLQDNPPDWPDKEWRGVRAMETALTLVWYYNRTGDVNALEAAKKIQGNSFKWTEYFLDFPYPREKIESAMAAGKTIHHHPTHVVNIAMATKYPGLAYELLKEARYKDAAYAGIEVLDRNHGQVGGRFSGDEHLAGTQPFQGTETCAVVEYMFSLSNLTKIFGEAAFADRLEMLAYNGNAGAHTEDYWCHQYDQQANQVLVGHAKRNWTTNGDDSNIFGLEPNFGCCTANMHQGWPKFVAKQWMATKDGGLALIAYGPNVVTAKVADGKSVTIRQDTQYPFKGTVKLMIEKSDGATFPLQVRWPAWTNKIEVSVNGEMVQQADGGKPGSFVAIGGRSWKSGDVVEIRIPMKLRVEKRRNDAVAIHRGPIVYSLKIGEKRTVLKKHHETLPVVDYAIEPTTPWNYALALDLEHPEKSIEVQEIGPGNPPYAQQNAPVVLKVKGKLLPEWKLVKNSAGPVPQSPVTSEEPLVDLELIPYGSGRLRVSEFPVLKQ